MQVTQQSGRCPCSCAQGSNDDVHLRPEFEFCTEGLFWDRYAEIGSGHANGDGHVIGDVCFFGKQWCARSIPDFASTAHTSQPAAFPGLPCMSGQCEC